MSLLLLCVVIVVVVCREPGERAVFTDCHTNPIFCEPLILKRIHFRHQSSDHKRNLMDIDIHVTPAVDDSLFSLETICFPVAVIEIGNAAIYSLDKKENQATAYALNLANRQNDRLRPFGLLALALTYDHNGISLRLSHVFANSIDGRNTIFRPLLFSSNHCTANDVNFAFALLVSFADRISAHWMVKAVLNHFEDKV